MPSCGWVGRFSLSNGNGSEQKRGGEGVESWPSGEWKRSGQSEGLGGRQIITTGKVDEA